MTLGTAHFPTLKELIELEPDDYLKQALRRADVACLQPYADRSAFYDSIRPEMERKLAEIGDKDMAKRKRYETFYNYLESWFYASALS
jgi:hypothetical protein